MAADNEKAQQYNQTYENKAYVPEYGIDENDNSAGYVWMNTLK